MKTPLFSLTCPYCGELIHFDAASIRWQAEAGAPARVQLEAVTNHRHP